MMAVALHTVVTVTLGLAFLASPALGGEPKGYGVVTWGSTLKLSHVGSGFRLNSQEVQYGSGSGQQSVTLIGSETDPGSLWEINPAAGKGMAIGAPIKCGTTLRLRHSKSGRWLHSHSFKSPLSGGQEVSAYGGDTQSDSGDNWVLECSGKTWERSEKVRFLHKDTKKYLHSTGRHQYNHPIAGHREVSCESKKGSLNQWIAKEGYFVKADTAAAKHDEL
eukprot:m.28948 g.28948  ORF g.28948 m.28948 type:complete len:220 (+) comp9093_c0_seq1:204-863(+)